MILPTGRQSKSASIAFTLIEIILVMVVLVTLIALAAPRLSVFLRQRHLEAEAERFVAVLEFAREQAINTGVPFQIIIEPERLAYCVRPFSGFPELDQVLQRYQLAEGVRFVLETIRSLQPSQPGGVAGYVITFRPDGSVDQEGMIAVGFEDRDGRRLFVVPSSWMGLFRVVDQEEFVRELTRYATEPSSW